MESFEKEYELLKASFAVLYSLVAPKITLPDNQHPIAVLESMEKTAPRNAMKGLKMALNDLIEMTAGWRPERVADIDKVLSEASLLTLSTLRHQYSRLYAKVLKRGRANNLEEYYLLKGVLDSGAATGDEVQTLTAILTVFESQKPSAVS